MRCVASSIIAVLYFLPPPALCGNTNVLIIPSGDHRAGAIFFVDECLTRGITNSISISDLRKWATNTIRVYQQRETNLVATQSGAGKHPRAVIKDIPQAIQSMQDRIPSCRSDEDELASIPDWQKHVKLYSKWWGVSEEEAGRRLRTIGPDLDKPQVDFWRSRSGSIEAVTIYWYIYGVIVGPESFKPEWDHPPWYHRKLADGIYLWHGYK